MATPATVAGQAGGFVPLLRKSVRRVFVRNLVYGASTALRINPATRPTNHQIRVVRNLAYRSDHPRAHRVDVYVPKRSSGAAVMYVHGGGFSMLSKDTHLALAMAFARRGYVVFNINYRLAPRHPFPAALEDVFSAYEWVVRHAAGFGADPHRLVLAGESAGANLVTSLALATCIRRPEEFAKRVFDLGIVPRAVVPACGIHQVSDVGRLWRRRPLPRWVRAILQDVSTGYLATSTGDVSLADPLLVLESAAKAERPLPAFFVPVGTRDPLLDDTRRLSVALQNRNATCLARYYPGEIHAFHALFWRPEAQRCWAEKFGFLSEQLG